MSPKTFAGLIAAAMLLISLFCLTNTITAAGVDCGSAIAPDPGAGCAEARDTRNAWALPLGAVGLVGLVGVAVVRRRPTTRKTSE